jgi:hypothetical protein
MGDFFYRIQHQIIAFYFKIKCEYPLEKGKQFLYLQAFCAENTSFALTGEILKRPTRADCKSAV